MEMNFADVVHFLGWHDLLKWVGETCVDLRLGRKLSFYLPTALHRVTTHMPPKGDSFLKGATCKRRTQMGELILNSEVMISLTSS